MLDEAPISILASTVVFLVTIVYALVQCGGKKADKTTDVTMKGGDNGGGDTTTKGGDPTTKKTETQTPSMMSTTKQATQATTVKNPTSVCTSQATKTQQQPTSGYNTTGDPTSTQQPSSNVELQKKQVTDDGGYDNLNPNSKPMSGPIPQ